MRIMTYELRKIWSNKLFNILLISAIIVNGIIFYYDNYTSTEYTAGEYNAVYHDISKLSPQQAQKQLTEYNTLLEISNDIQKYLPINDEILSDLENRYGQNIRQYITQIQEGISLKYCNSLKAELALLFDVLEQINCTIGYTGYLDNIHDQAKSMSSVSIFQKKDNIYSQNNIIKTAQDFKSLYPVSQNIQMDKSQGIIIATDYSFTDIILIILLLLFCYFIMIKEKQTGSLGLLKTNYNGHGPLIWGKTGAILISTIMICLLLYGSNLLVSYTLYGFGDLNRNIQSVEMYMSCALNISVGQFLLLYLIFKIIIFCVIALLILLICYVINNTSFIYLITAGIYAAQMGIYFSISAESYFAIFKYINFYYFTQSQYIIGVYQNINIGGHPVSSFYAFLFTMAIIFIVALVIIIFLFCRHYIGFIKKIPFQLQIKMKTVSTNLQFHEFYKISITNMACLILILFTVFQFFSYQNYKPFMTMDDIYYQDYVKIYGGAVNDETLSKINQKSQEFESIEKNLSNIQQQFKGGNLTPIEFSAKSYYLNKELEKKPAFLKLQERYIELLDLTKTSGIPCNLIFEKQYDLLTNNIIQDITNGLKLVLILIALLGGYFAMEYTSKMNCIIITCYNGKKATVKKKLLSSIFMGSIAFIITYLPDFRVTSQHFGFQTLNTSLNSLSQFQHLNWNISIGIYLLIVLLIRYLATVSCIVIISMISELTKRPLISYLVSTVLLAFPFILYFFRIQLLSKISFISFFSGNIIFIQQNPITIISVIFYCCFSVLNLFLLIRQPYKLQKN